MPSAYFWTRAVRSRMFQADSISASVTDVVDGWLFGISKVRGIMTDTTRRRLSVGVLGIAAVIGGLINPPTAAAQSSSTFVIPFERTGIPGVDGLGNPTGAFQNPCTLEFVDVTGSSTVSITQQLANQKGEIKTSIGVSSKGSGAGWIEPYPTWTGHSYVFSENQSIVTVVPALATGEVFESTFSDKFTMKGAGNLDNWVVRAYFKLKVDSKGTIQVSIDRMTGDVCHG